MDKDGKSEKFHRDCSEVYNGIRNHVNGKYLPSVMASFNLLFAELLYINAIEDVNEEYDEKNMIDEFFSDFKRATIRTYNSFYKDNEGNLKKRRANNG